MAEKQNVSDEETAVRDLIEAWADSRYAEGLRRNSRSHAADFVMFDVPPPFKSVGLDAYRKTWDVFSAWARDPVRCQISGDGRDRRPLCRVAFASMRCEGPGSDGQPEALDFRLTVCLRGSMGGG